MKPRTCATLLPDKPKQLKPILETAAMEAVILAEVRKPDYDFVAASPSGLSPERPGDEVGWLYQRCLLSQLRTALFIQGELEDDKVFAALDALSKAKSLIVWKVSQSRRMAGNDFCFDLVLGGALRGFRKPFTAPQIIPRWLNGELFKRVPKKPLCVVEAVRSVRRQAEERIANRFAHLPDLSLESRLHRAEIEERACLKAAILKLADMCAGKADMHKLMELIDGKK